MWHDPSNVVGLLDHVVLSLNDDGAVRPCLDDSVRAVQSFFSFCRVILFDHDVVVISVMIVVTFSIFSC